MRSAYIGLIRSVIEYGCVVYRSASYTSLLRLDRIQAKALRRCCEAVKSTPLSALQVLLDQSTKANSPLKGHERTVQYLQRLGKDQRPARVCFSLQCQSCHLFSLIYWLDAGKASEKMFLLIDCTCWMKCIV